MPTHTPAERRRNPGQGRGFERPSGFDPLGDVERAQDFTREGVLASGELLRPEILSRIGDTLGGLNEIGALRSGGTRVALGEINREFTDRIGSIASRATLGALGTGVSAGGLRLQEQLGNRELQFREDEAKRKRKASLLRAIGGVVGAGVGFAIAGPPGAVAGAGAGG